MKKILVTGASGQLGQCLKELSNDYKILEFIFLESTKLDVTNSSQIETVFKNNNFDFCINCAAYTAVDKAETEKELAFKTNVLGAKYLAEACNQFNVTLIHVSTDFVFDGIANKPYKESDPTNPIGVYGSTKLEGEKAIQSILKKHYIIRTSWLYSHYKTNFVKTMIRLATEKDELNIIDNQKGTPTNAIDLAKVIIKIINFENTDFGIYHYSNLGKTTWYTFAKTIFKLTNTKINVNPVTSNAFKTIAKRPTYSVLDKTKISHTFKIEIPNWEESLKQHFKFSNKN